MLKGTKTRLICHEILFGLKYKNKNLDELLNNYFENQDFSESDKKMTHNIVLSSMRHNFKVKKIIKKYVKKKINAHQFILFLSSITQIVFLDFKDYAVVNTTVELAKDKSINVFPGFINAVLKNICKDKEKLLEIKTDYKDLPNWFNDQTKNLPDKEKNILINRIEDKPTLHLVFKKEIPINYFNINLKNTSNKSIAILENIKIENIPGYINGDWWVQDYSSMLPIFLTENIENKKILDMCAAPGGKAFQAISRKGDVKLIEINKRRAKVLEKNLCRLNYRNKIFIEDSLEIKNNEKYDLVLIDAPCSSVGTLRRSPEIFFREKPPKFQELILKQEKLLNKAKDLVKEGGEIIYMICSFIESEGELQVNKFININKNFTLEKFKANKEIAKLIDKNGYINILPTKLNMINIDGFFAAKLVKNDKNCK